MEKIDASNYGLNSRIKLFENGDEIILDKRRKSRIIMKDGIQILDISRKIIAQNKDAKIALLTSGPVCSKTIKFLEKEKIRIIRK